MPDPKGKVPAVREGVVEGIFCADIHFSDKPPIMRSKEEDWILTQIRYIKQLRKIQVAAGSPPIFIAGDLFNKWDCSLFLVNCLLRTLKGMKAHAIPGNHDIPNHNWHELNRSAYWTLVESDVITHLEPGGTHTFGSIMIHPFPYKHEVLPPNKGNGLCLHVALIHSYIWTKDTGYEGADEEDRYAVWAKKLEGYDVAFFGDNHQPFHIAKEGKCRVVNCGAFVRRILDEKDISPCVWLLHSNGTVTRKYIDTSADNWLDIQSEVKLLEKAIDMDLSELTEELGRLHNERMDFVKVVLQWVDKQNITEPVRNIILRAIREIARR